MALSSESKCFRYDVLPSYKHNRANIARPILRSELNHYVKGAYSCKQKPNIEGDDVLGILATQFPGEYIVCSLDKDLNQIPGWHYNWGKDFPVYYVTPEEGDLFFYRQTLTGDTQDGYKGCPKIGKQKALKLLPQGESQSTYWDIVVEQYELKGLTEADALQQARCARILRNTDWDFNAKEVILWTPIKENK